ncbi:uncharacterized protein [Drosophila takahashii]|uniref:uncharacterized protein n=1 Tax=Drosophila takahashii TaxID=29030 RepID=UPI001CF848C7|nr:putative uncharacterized protein DDB_G0271606 [Drosophila takahashii]XP_017004413.2 putative uncharacterized protein DDB_G0271606 [Drosophila takahashii]
MSHHMPRRTSEFRGTVLEDRGTADKRQTRATKRSTAALITPSSGQVNPRRRSAIPQPQPMNLERDRFTQMGVTPKRGLHHHRTAPSTAERPVAPHSDKKWVAERAQQILEYLQDANPAALSISELYNRPGGLRHMTIKQFVSILNFLFQHIWRNRVTVGQNHVEDITSAMQKLQYPYQVNKSWLVSPTTSHSFGHVILLLDFLLDFASSEEPGFPFMETSDQPSVHGESSQLQAIQLEEEVNALLFAEASKCFLFWDQELLEEQLRLQAETGDQVVSKKCDLPDRQALDRVIEELQKKLQVLEGSNDGNKLEQLIEEQEQLVRQLSECQAEVEQQRNLDKRLAEQAEEQQAHLRQQAKYELRLEQAVSSQKYSAQQLKALQIKAADLENYSQAYERQVKEVSELELHQQVMLSRAKQRQLDCVEGFNSHVRHLSMDPLIGNLMKAKQLDLSLPLNPQPEDIDERMQCLQLLGHLLQQQRQQNLERRQLFSQQVDQLKSPRIELEAEIGSLESQMLAHKQRLAKLEAGQRSRRDMAMQHQRQLLEDQTDQLGRVEQLEQRKQQAAEQLQASVQRNEDLLTAGELHQEEDHQARNASLDNCELKLAGAEEELQALQTKLTVSQAKLEVAEQREKSLQLASFEPVLQAIKQFQSSRGPKEDR